MDTEKTSILDSELEQEIVGRIPNNFFNKEINEPFIRIIMEKTQKIGKWEKGNPNLREPDYFGDGKGYEFTIASAKKRKNNFIQKLMNGTYSTEDMEAEMIQYIESRIVDKASKNYSTSEVNLCVLCLLEQFLWVSDVYGSTTYALFNHRRQIFFDRIKKEYIDTKIFENIYILFPDMTAKWWVFNVATGERIAYQLTYKQMKSGDYPFIIMKNVCEEIEELRYLI